MPFLEKPWMHKSKRSRYSEAQKKALEKETARKVAFKENVTEKENVDKLRTVPGHIYGKFISYN